MEPLYKRIKKEDFLVTEDLITKWESAMFLIRTTMVNSTKTISVATANKYRFDLYGLFVNEFRISPEYVYPHVRANGFYTSNNYDGNKLTFTLLDVGQLHSLYRAFIKGSDTVNAIKSEYTRS